MMYLWVRQLDRDLWMHRGIQSRLCLSSKFQIDMRNRKENKIKMTDFLFVVHSPISADKCVNRMNFRFKQKKISHILLLLPVPRSIMICLLL